MELHPDIEDILLKDFTNSELTDTELQILKSWLNESHRNEKIYAQMKLAFLSPKSDEVKKVKGEILSDLQKQGKVTKIASAASHRADYFWLRVAAVFVFCVSIGLMVYRMTTDKQKQMVVSTEVQMVGKVSQLGQKLTTILPDGTIVKLNGDSKILYAENFVGETREIFLYGEAFFDVVRDETKPFIIKTKDIQIQVMGTSFNIKSYPGKETSVVSVASGKVAVTDLDHQTIALFPGEKISYQADLGTMKKDNYQWEEEYGWKDNILIFQQESFQHILERLRKWYGVDFVLESNIPNLNKKFSGRYNDPTLKAVLEGLSYVYNFNYAIGTNTVILNSKQNMKNEQ